jgi:hypothetical protein
MNLLFIHGAPAAGKLTTAKAVIDRVGGRLFDNHAAIDLARTVFEFAAPGFWELVASTRLVVLEAAVAQDLPLLVMTFVYADPLDLPTFEKFEAVVQRNDGQVLPVFLRCAVDEIARRIGNPDRAIKNKLTSEQSVRDLMERYSIVPVPRSDCLVLDSEARSADENAEAIIGHFGLTDLR